MATRKAIIFGLIGLGAAGSWAQVPEIAVFADLHPTLLSPKNGEAYFRWYDWEGRPSTVGFRMVMENGNRVLVSQRVQRFPGNGDRDQLDEYWLEDTGRWRIGKQILPFGERRLVRQTGLALRFDTNLLFNNAPLQIAFVNNGSGLTRGIVGRIGDRAGISFAYGDHFGAQAPNLALIDGISGGKGKGRGYQFMMGADFDLPFGSSRVSVEWVSMRDGETAQDVDRDVSDLRAVWLLSAGHRAGLGWSRDWKDARSVYRIYAEYVADDQVTVTPILRIEGGSFKDFGVTARVRF